MDRLYIPTKIKVGYQERNDTYTKRLAYVICYDNKGKLRKETSWKGWIDDELETPDYDNVPTSGFVLNKKAGGGGHGWEHRQMKCRVYDPRGFEFEIAIDNLLFILQETNSYKGKGLEGEFVYAWAGKDLVLLPASCEEYTSSQNFTKLQTQKVKAKDLVPGYVYKTKRLETWTYIGKLPWFNMAPVKDTSRRRWNYIMETVSSTQFVFVNEDKDLAPVSSIACLAECAVESVSPDFAELKDIYTNSIHCAKPVGLVEKDIVIDFNEKTNHSFYDQLLCRKFNDTTYIEYQIYPQKGYRYEKLADGVTNDYSKPGEYILLHYQLHPRSIVKIDNGVISKDSDYSILTNYNFKERYLNPRYSLASAMYSWNNQYEERAKEFTKEDILSLNYKELYVTLENGKEIPFKNYN